MSVFHRAVTKTLGNELTSDIFFLMLRRSSSFNLCISVPLDVAGPVD